MRKTLGTSRLETTISVLILMGLMLIGVAIFIKQQHYDPRVIRPTFVVSNTEERGMNRGVESTGVSGAVAEFPSGGYGESSSETSDSAAPVLPHTGRGVLASLDSIGGIRALGGVEQFDAVTLSDKIDGRAEFYLELGFESLETRRYGLGSQPPQQCEVFVFRMASPLAAFAAWSNQRRPDAQPEASIPLTYRTANALYFVKGTYYVELVSPWGEFGGADLARSLVKELYDKIQDTSDQGNVLAVLPSEGRVPGSERLLLKDAFGFSKLDNVVLADYVVEQTTVSLWISTRQSETEAHELAKAYHKYLTQELGAEDATARLGGRQNFYAVDALGDLEIIGSCDKRLLGIRGLKSRVLNGVIAILDSVCH
ncbi:MAG: hypothetical protein N2Z21_09540 [Candidatus Sumerlaeaceae bacterium]|nr:hypothetical protein [Candidatus Sumerlaeaceae bacterium]